MKYSFNSLWPLATPFLAALVALWALESTMGGLAIALSSLALVGAVLASVHHAEVIAHRVGEPYGTLVLALAVTIIEVALIVSIMLADGALPTSEVNPTASLPRDTIYAAIMIICNGVVGFCILLGGMRHREQSFRIEGAHSGLAALATLAGLVLVLPNFTTSSPEGTYTAAQLVFAGLSSLALWSVFVFIQTIRHRDYFYRPMRPTMKPFMPARRRSWSLWSVLRCCWSPWSRWWSWPKGFRPAWRPVCVPLMRRFKWSAS